MSPFKRQPKAQMHNIEECTKFTVVDALRSVCRGGQALTYHRCLMTARCLPRQQHMGTGKIRFTIHLAAALAAITHQVLLERGTFWRRRASLLHMTLYCCMLTKLGICMWYTAHTREGFAYMLILTYMMRNSLRAKSRHSKTSPVRMFTMLCCSTIH